MAPVKAASQMCKILIYKPSLCGLWSQKGAGPAIVPDVLSGYARMSIFRTSLPHSGKSPSTTMTLLLKAFCQRLGQAFQARGMLQLGMLDGIVATLEENARKDRLRALYPTSTTFGSFADGPTATAMQPPTTHPR